MFKFLFKVTLIGAVVAGGALLIAEPARVCTFMSQVKQEVTEVIDDNIDDPVALRRQLAQLEREYPERIAQVRGDLAELREQMNQLERERAIAAMVVQFAEADMESIQGELALATRTANEYGARPASLQTTIANSNVQRKQAQLSQVQHTALAYTAQAQDAARDLGYLEKQAARLEGLLAQLEGEHAQFKAQLMQLDRQVDAVARNERLIALMEKREKTISELSRYEVGSLEHLQGRLAEIRARQEAELQVLSDTHQRASYEERARIQVDLQGGEPAVEIDLPIWAESALAPKAEQQVVTPAF